MDYPWRYSRFSLSPPPIPKPGFEPTGAGEWKLGYTRVGSVFLLLAYLFKNAEIERETVNQFIKHFPDNLNHKAISTYDMIKAERIEKGAELKEREFIKNLWSFQEFSLEKIALLSGASLEREIEILSAHLQAEGLSEAVAAQTLEAYQAKFV